MELLKVDSLDEAILKLYNAYTEGGKGLDVEERQVLDALDYILAEKVVSSVAVPEFDRSVVDGYAVIASDTQGANDSIPTFLKVVGESKMGEPCDIELKSGECVYVPTGSMIPKNSNACVMVEHTESITDDKVAIYEAVADGKSVVRKGDDIKEGEVIFEAGRKLSAADIGFLSSIGIYKVKVFKKWNITIISTGDELVDEKSEYKFGKIRDINTNLLSALSIKFGFKIINKFLLKDDAEILEKTLKTAMSDSDVVVISGGSSKGKKDASSLVIDKVTSSGVLTHGIAVKPGKPTITGYDKNTNTVVVGLPGHPVASAVLFKLVVCGLYDMITKTEAKDLVCEGIMTENMPASPGRMTFQLVKLDKDFNVTPIFGRSGLIHTLSESDGYIVLEIDQEGIKKGDKIIVYYL
jgi:molybdopterin molybdotransferase